MQWFKFWHDRWLEGDIRRDFNNEERSMFVDLLSLCSRYGFRDGAIRTAVGKPLTRERICQITNQPRELLDRVITKGQAAINGGDKMGRIEIWDDGTIYIPKFKEMNTTKQDTKGKAKPSDEAVVNAILSRNPELQSKIETRVKIKLAADETQLPKIEQIKAAGKEQKRIADELERIKDNADVKG